MCDKAEAAGEQGADGKEEAAVHPFESPMPDPKAAGKQRVLYKKVRLTAPTPCATPLEPLVSSSAFTELPSTTVADRALAISAWLHWKQFRLTYLSRSTRAAAIARAQGQVP